MPSVVHILITKGREIVGGAPLTQEDARVCLDILTQPGTDTAATLERLGGFLGHLQQTGAYKPTLRIGVSLRSSCGLYAAPDTGLPVRVARMLVTAYRLKNEPGMGTLRKDLGRVISGTVAPGSTLLPFLSSESILPKA